MHPQGYVCCPKTCHAGLLAFQAGGIIFPDPIQVHLLAVQLAGQCNLPAAIQVHRQVICAALMLPLPFRLSALRFFAASLITIAWVGFTTV